MARLTHPELFTLDPAVWTGRPRTRVGHKRFLEFHSRINPGLSCIYHQTCVVRVVAVCSHWEIQITPHGYHTVSTAAAINDFLRGFHVRAAAGFRYQRPRDPSSHALYLFPHNTTENESFFYPDGFVWLILAPNTRRIIEIRPAP